MIFPLEGGLVGEGRVGVIALLSCPWGVHYFRAVRTL